jgi:hypothetical protein
MIYWLMFRCVYDVTKGITRNLREKNGAVAVRTNDSQLLD